MIFKKVQIITLNGNHKKFNKLVLSSLSKKSINNETMDCIICAYQCVYNNIIDSLSEFSRMYSSDVKTEIDKFISDALIEYIYKRNFIIPDSSERKKIKKIFKKSFYTISTKYKLRI